MDLSATDISKFMAKKVILLRDMLQHLPTCTLDYLEFEESKMTLNSMPNCIYVTLLSQ